MSLQQTDFVASRPWSPLRSMAPAQSRAGFRFAETAGAGPEAKYLENCLHKLVLVPPVVEDEGWQTPPTAVIPVRLAGLRDAEWTLEEDELGF
ncbi:MAG: hypothetical protein ACHREM_19330 [Polyangiales bacterium]